MIDGFGRGAGAIGGCGGRAQRRTSSATYGVDVAATRSPDHGQALRRVLALSFGSDFIHWRRSGESWPRAWPRRRLLFLMAAVAAQVRGRGAALGLATSRLGPADVEVRVWDSNAEIRYMVLPMRPAGTDGWSEEKLAELVTRDTMIGTDVPEGKA